MSTQRLIVTLSVALAVTGFMLAHSLFSTTPVVIKRYNVIVWPRPTVVVDEVPVQSTPPGSVVFTERQLGLLHIAYEEGERVGWPETIQALLLQESTAGLNGPVGDRQHDFGKRSYCHMQMKLAAVQDVLRHYPELGQFTTDEELLVELLTNDRFCIQVAAHHFKFLADNTRNWSEAVLAYNRGLTGAKSGSDPRQYIAGIRDKIHNWIRPHGSLLMSNRQQLAMVDTY